MKSLLRSILLLTLVLPALAAFGAASSAIEDLEFSSAQEQARYQKLITELRCPKCLNVNLAGSDAPIAADLRAVIFEQLQAGRTDKEIIEFLTNSYGEFILYRPRLHPGTVLLWFGPPLLLLAGFYIARRMLAASAAQPSSAVLSSEEQSKLASLLADKKDQA